MSAKIVNMFMYLQHGQPFPAKLNIKGNVSMESLVGYANYTAREQSRESKLETQLEFNGGYFEYTSRESARTEENKVRTFTNKGWIESKEEYLTFKEQIAGSFNQDGDLCWVPVSSFKDIVSAQQYGLFNEEDYASIFATVLPKFFKRVGLEPDNMIWWMDYHTNKVHPHTHVAFMEKNKTRQRPTFTLKEINDFKGLIFKEAFAREQILNSTELESIKSFKEKDDLYQSVRELSIKKILSRDNKLINKEIINLFNRIDTDPELIGNRLQYRSFHMNPYRDDIDKIVNLVLSMPGVNDGYLDLLEKCEALDQVKVDHLTTIYTNIKDAEDQRLRSYLGNQILKLKKNNFSMNSENLIEYDDQDPFSEASEVNLSDSEEEVIENHKLNYWTDQYKAACDLLYTDEPDYKKAYHLFLIEAEKGNPMAMSNIANLIKNGKVENEFNSDQWNQRSLKRFMDLIKIKHSDYYCYRIGKFFHYGIGTDQDYHEALNYYQQAREYKYSQFSLGSMHAKGQGVDIDFEKAAEYFKKANLPFGNYQLGIMILNKKIKGSKEEMESYFTKAYSGFQTMKQNEQINILLGKMNEQGLGIKANIQNAFNYYLKAYKKEDYSIAYKLAEMIRKDKVENKDKDFMNELYAKAIIHYQDKFENEQNPMAAYLLSKMYQEGLGTEKNLEMAISYYSKCSEDNDLAHLQLAKIYEELEDDEKYIEHLTSSADLNNSYAQHRLAKELYSGNLVDRNLQQAIYYCEKSLDNGNNHCKLFLSKMYVENSEVPKGLKLLQECCKEGNDYALLRLGFYHLKGEAVPKDREQGLKYINAAAELGNAFAKDFIKSDLEKQKELAMKRKMHRFSQKLHGSYSSQLITNALRHLADHNTQQKIEQEIDQYYEGKEFI